VYDFFVCLSNNNNKITEEDLFTYFVEEKLLPKQPGNPSYTFVMSMAAASWS